MIAHRQVPQETRPFALNRLHDLELLDARDRLLLAGLVGRHPRGAYAENLAGLQARIDREGCR